MILSLQALTVHLQLHSQQTVFFYQNVASLSFDTVNAMTMFSKSSSNDNEMIAIAMLAWPRHHQKKKTN